MNSKGIFFSGFLFNLCIFLIRFWFSVGWVNLNGIHVDLYKDFELYANENSFLSFISFKNEIILTIFIFLINMMNGLIIYKIKPNDEILFMYYFNPITVFYFSLMLLNSTVFTFFLLISYYYLEKEQYTLSILFYIISLLMKQYAIVFILIILYQKYKKPYVAFLILLGFSYLFVSPNIFNLNIIFELRLRLTTLAHDYSISLFPREFKYAIISYILLTFCVYFALSDKNLDLLQKTTILLLLFEFFSQFGICKYYIFSSLIFTLLNRPRFFLFSSFGLFFIPRHFLMIYILFLILINKCSRIRKKQ